MGRSDQLHFVQMHGAQHGAWCWCKTKSLLEGVGHRVSAPDLTSAGVSPVSADDVRSFDHYIQPLFDVLESLTDSEKLWGRAGGARDRAVREEGARCSVRPACMLGSEQPISEVWLQVFKEFEGDMRYSFGRGAGAGANPTSGWVVGETARRTYFSSCAPKDVQLGMMLLRPTPCMSDDATAFTKRGYRSVPRMYIRTALDACLKPEFQDLLIQRNRPREVRTIEAGHAPHLCAAKELHRHLLQIAATYVKNQ